MSGIFELMDAVVCEFYGISQEILEHITPPNDEEDETKLKEFDEMLVIALDGDKDNKSKGLVYIEKYKK